MAETQNPVLNSANSVLDTVLGTLKEGVDIYSSFLSARATSKLASMGSYDPTLLPNYSPALAQDQAVVNQRVTSWLLYAGVAIAAIAVGGLVWKAVK